MTNTEQHWDPFDQIEERLGKQVERLGLRVLSMNFNAKAKIAQVIFAVEDEERAFGEVPDRVDDPSQNEIDLRFLAITREDQQETMKQELLDRVAQHQSQGKDEPVEEQEQPEPEAVPGNLMDRLGKNLNKPQGGFLDDDE